MTDMRGTREARPSYAMVDGAYIRIGSWGPLRNECALIEGYRQEGRSSGPVTIDYLPGGMWKVFRNDVFMRYVNAGQVKEMAHHIALGNLSLFEAMVEATETEQPDRGDYGPQPEACKWIEEHDEVLVSYAGSDKNWPTGCWQIQHDGGEQFVNEKQLLAVAEQLGMARQHKSDFSPNNLGGWFGVIKQMGRESRRDLDDAFGAGAEEPYPELDEAFASPVTVEDEYEWADLEEAFG